MNKYALLLALPVFWLCQLDFANAQEETAESAAPRGTTTHLGVKASQLISLRGTGICPGNPQDGGLTDQILSDGTIRPGFVIPKGKVLVITDLDFSSESAAPGTPLAIRLSIVSPSGGAQLLATNPEIVDVFGRAASHIHLTAGIVVNRNATLCFNPNPHVGDPGFDVHVYGYLASKE